MVDLKVIVVSAGTLVPVFFYVYYSIANFLKCKFLDSCTIKILKKSWGFCNVKFISYSWLFYKQTIENPRDEVFNSLKSLILALGFLNKCYLSFLIIIMKAFTPLDPSVFLFMEIESIIIKTLSI